LLVDPNPGSRQLITGVDWAPNSNMLVTCSHDRTASVWTKTEDGKGWAPSMVVLKDFGRGATTVKWSPCETRFAVGSGGKQIQVCAYEAEQDWWIGKPFREGIESTIFDIAFHPSSLLIAAGGCDKKVLVFSAIIKALDSKAAAKEVFGDVKPPKFGEKLFEFKTSGWVNGLAFSPSGNILSVASHDSRMHFLSTNVASFEFGLVSQLRLKGLPATKVAFLDEKTCVAAGFDMVPNLYSSSSGEWKVAGVLDVVQEKEKKKKGAAAMWADRDNRAGQEAHEHKTTHENNITSIWVKPGSSEEFTTAGLDGRVVFWNTSLEASFGGLKLRQS